MKKNRFEIRMTDKEASELERLAQKHGCSKAAYLRNSAFNRPMVDMETAERLREVKTELNRIGNNINQIARRWNESGSDMAHLSFLDEQMTEIHECLREVRDYCYYKTGRKRKKNPNA